MTEAFGLNAGRNDDPDSKECVICLTNKKDTLVLPCKHVSMCNTCAVIVLRSERKCPVCRTSKNY
jgi:E3 ubiquitin-protein ligase MGRN1